MAEADSWNQRYVDGRTGWDLGAVPPVIHREAEAWIATHGEAARASASVLVPGAGRAHDARGWAKAGFPTTAVDFAPLALREAEALARADGVELELVEADVTALPAPWKDRFAVVWEQTCLCALPVELREPYLDELRRVVMPDGLVLALLWNHGNEGGPPWDMTEALVRRLVEGRFEVLSREAVADSPAGRSGE